MVIVFIYGLALSLVSFLLLIKPDRCVDWGTRYCKWQSMHLIEILINLLFGATFLYFASEMRFTSVFQAFGAMLLIVGFGLILAGAEKHRKFGLWSIDKCRRALRPLAPVSLAFGLLVMYSAL